MDMHEEAAEVDIELTTFGPNMNELLFRLQSGFCDYRVMDRNSDEQIVIRANYAKVKRLLRELLKEQECDIAHIWQHDTWDEQGGTSHRYE